MALSSAPDDDHVMYLPDDPMAAMWRFFQMILVLNINVWCE